MKNKRFGFTLAEVLLAMTIIGTIAAMTIPTLHYQQQKKEYSTKLKNFYSKVNNAVLDMEMEKGTFKDLQVPAEGSEYDWYLEYIDPYIGHELVDSDESSIYLKDGSKVVDLATNQNCLELTYDVNGDKPPSRLGVDQYRFLFCFTNTERANRIGNHESFFGAYGDDLTDPTTTRDDKVEACKDIPETCSKLLENDQWEFKPGYPHKF